MVRRLLFIVTATMASLVLFAGSAFAHFCFIASRSPQGAQAAGAHSDTWGSVPEFLSEAGMCQAGIQHVEMQISEATGLEPGVIVINERVVMAQGLFNSLDRHEHLAGNRRGVDWVSDEMFAQFDVWVGEGFALC